MSYGSESVGNVGKSQEYSLFDEGKKDEGIISAQTQISGVGGQMREVIEKTGTLEEEEEASSSSAKSKRRRVEGSLAEFQPAHSKRKTEVIFQREVGNREIEFKATRVDPTQFKNAQVILGEISGVIKRGAVAQKDHYLNHPAFSDTEQYMLYGKGSVSKSLRIRQETTVDGEGNNHTLCLKVARKGKVEADHERQEYEAKIGDPSRILEIFYLLGFSADKIIQKQRCSFLYKEYEVVFDEVVGLKKTSEQTYEEEFSTYIVEVELKEGAQDVKDVPACLREMEQFIEGVLKITTYVQEQSGMEKYMGRK